MGQNPLLYQETLPPFDKIKPEHVVPAATKILEEVNAEFTNIEQEFQKGLSPTWSNLVERLDELDHRLFKVWSPVSHLMGVMNSDALRSAYEEMQPKIVNFGLRTSQSSVLYHALENLQKKGSLSSHAQQRIVERSLASMKLSGVGLEGAPKVRFNEIAQELAALKTKFSNNALDSAKQWSMTLTHRDETAGLPEFLLEIASHEHNRSTNTKDSTPAKGPWRLTQDMPLYIPFMENSTRRDLRERMYRGRILIASEGNTDNSPLIEKILLLRQEQATILGYKTFAETSLVTKMAGRVEAADELLEELLKSSWNPGKKEHQELEAFAKSLGFTDQLLEWDIPYYAERLKEQKFEYNEDELRPYFPIPKVLDGLFNLVQKIFAVRIVPADGKAPVWHADVKYFEVLDEKHSKMIASFYLDPFARAGLKRQGAWMDDCANRRKIGSKLELPVAHLVCNGTPPVDGKPGLMSFDEVNTLFHEFGHGLQHMLTTIDEPGASGINGVEWDAVELASQFMENWLYHEPVLRSISGHVETGKPLPEEIVKKILAARTYRAASMMLRQLHFALTDLELHHRYTPGGQETSHDVFNRIAKRTNILPPRPENRFLCAFSHIFAGGYSAGYYSYKWAEVLSADAYAAFEEVGLNNEAGIKQTGRKFRDTVLSLGGSEHPMTVFKEFRGRAPSTKALLRHSGLT